MPLTLSKEYSVYWQWVQSYISTWAVALEVHSHTRHSNTTSSVVYVHLHDQASFTFATGYHRVWLYDVLFIGIASLPLSSSLCWQLFAACEIQEISTSLHVSFHSAVLWVSVVIKPSMMALVQYVCILVEVFHLSISIGMSLFLQATM